MFDVYISRALYEDILILVSFQTTSNTRIIFTDSEERPDCVTNRIISLKKVYRPTGNSLALKKSPIDIDLFMPFRYRLFQSGTASLSVAMAASMKLKNAPAGKSEIIMPAYACPDLVSAALYAGAIPILADLEENSPFMSCEHILNNITAQTVAIVGINFMGLPGNLPKLKEICVDNDLFLIYDCAQWFPLKRGYVWPGDFNIISFGRGKPVSLLHGGAVILDNPEVEKALPALSVKKHNAIYNFLQAFKVRIYNYMVHPLIYRFASQLPGLNVGQTLYKPLQTVTPMSAYYAELINTNIDRFQAQQNALLYLHKSVKSILHPLMINVVSEELDDKPEYLLRYPILIKDKKRRDLFYEQTRNYGTSILYRRPLHQISGLEKILDQATVYPNACNFADHLVTLPCHEDIDNSVVDIIVDKLRSVLNRELPRDIN